MLGKLLKYEFKSTTKLMIPFVSIPILIALFYKILISIGYVNIEFVDFTLSIMRSILEFSYSASIMALIVMVFVILFNRFNTGLLGKSGYLYFTLPVKISQLIFSHIISAITWIIASIISIITSSILFGLIRIDIEQIRQMFSNISLSQIINIIILLFIVFGLIIDFVMTIYTSVAIGHLANKRRGLLGFGAYAGIYFVKQILAITFLITMVTDAFYGSNIIYQNTYFFAIALLLVILILAIYFFIMKYIFSKKLNLK